MKFTAIANDQGGTERRLTVEAASWEAVERGLADRKFTAIRRVEDIAILAGASTTETPALQATYVVQIATFFACVFALWGLAYMVALDVISGSFTAMELLWYGKAIIWAGLCGFLLFRPEVLARVVPARPISLAVLIPMACGLYVMLNGIDGLVGDFIRLCISLTYDEKEFHGTTSGDQFRYLVIAVLKTALGYVIMRKAEPLAALARLGR